MREAKAHWQHGRVSIMGVLNVTPDSFSDGGRYVGLEAALRQAETLIEAGADILDVGGESTRPGAAVVSVQEELDRVCPVVEAIGRRWDVCISLDTSTPEVMREGVALGAGMINDVRALQRAGALQAAVECAVPVCLMHMQGQPGSMQLQPAYQDVHQDVVAFLSARAQAAVEAGIPEAQICLDPGFGFGKSLAHNLVLMRRLSEMCGMGYPVLVGVSRKSMIGQITGREVDARLAGGLALATWALLQGAAILRVHDVAETVDVVRVVEALKRDRE